VGYTKFILLFPLQPIYRYGGVCDIEHQNILVRKRIGKLKRFIKIEEETNGN